MRLLFAVALALALPVGPVAAEPAPVETAVPLPPQSAPPTQAGPALRTDQVRILYSEPQSDKHRVIRAAMQERRMLETLGAILNAFMLPRELLLEVRSCDGREGAFYANDRAVMCYEYVELIQRFAPKVATPGGVARDDAIFGGVVDTLLHEAGHAVIDMLDIPVLGREEDAADFFSVYLQLQFPPEDAKRMLEGVAFMMGSEGREDLGVKLRAQLLAGAHSPEAQRHFNVLCLAYGANPPLFGDITAWGVPPWRARSCGDEFAMLKRAFGKLILPYVDEIRLREAIAQARLNLSPLAKSAESFDKPPLRE